MLLSSRAAFADAERKLYQSIDFGSNDGKYILSLKVFSIPADLTYLVSFSNIFSVDAWERVLYALLVSKGRSSPS